jgi:PAS domain S-box-containing protein
MHDISGPRRGEDDASGLKAGGGVVRRFILFWKEAVVLLSAFFLSGFLFLSFPCHGAGNPLGINAGGQTYRTVTPESSSGTANSGLAVNNQVAPLRSSDPQPSSSPPLYTFFEFWLIVVALAGSLIALIVAVLFWNGALREAVKARNRDMERERTHRLKAELKAEKANGYARNLIQASLDMIVSVDPEGRILEFNQAAQDTFGYRLDEIRGQDVRRLYAQEKEADLVMEQLERSGQFMGEITNLKKNGDRFTALLSAALIHDGSGTVTGSVGTSRDITERKKAEEARLESERLYRELFNSIGDLVFSLDSEGVVLAANPAATSLIGLSQDQVVGRCLAEFLTPPDGVDQLTRYLDRLKTDGWVEGVYKQVGPTGSARYIEVKSTKVHRRPAPPYISVSGRDITDRVRTQREINRIREQLLQSQKMEAIGTLASGIAHDFNNILQAVSGYIQLMMVRGDSPEENTRYLEAMARKVERAADLVRRLLTFSRKVEPDLKPMDLGWEIMETIQILERTLPKMITLEAALADDLWLVQGDASQMEQVLFNLATNAKDAMPEGGRLTFRAENVRLNGAVQDDVLGLETGPYVLLTVTDTGVGMTREIRERVFEPFFTTKDEGEGTGLGLPSVYGIVQTHGGHIRCESSPGRGTSFIIHLPALPDQAETGDEAPVNPITTSRGQETILLVDDDESIIEVAAEILESRGYKIMRAQSGEEALEVFRERGADIDLVILDLGMPGMGGRQCLTHLLALDANVKVIISSGYQAESPTMGGLPEGARGFIGKPYHLGDMLSQVRTVLDEAKPS